jgi:hypothetical protein
LIERKQSDERLVLSNFGQASHVWYPLAAWEGDAQIGLTSIQHALVADRAGPQTEALPLGMEALSGNAVRLSPLPSQ